MSSTVPQHPGPLHHPDPEAEAEAEGEGEGEAEAGDAAGCPPEVAGATTMEARLGAVAAVAAGDVVAVAVDVAPPLDDERA